VRESQTYPSTVARRARSRAHFVAVSHSTYSRWTNILTRAPPCPTHIRSLYPVWAEFGLRVARRQHIPPRGLCCRFETAGIRVEASYPRVSLCEPYLPSSPPPPPTRSRLRIKLVKLDFHAPALTRPSATRLAYGPEEPKSTAHPLAGGNSGCTAVAPGLPHSLDRLVVELDRPASSRPSAGVRLLPYGYPAWLGPPLRTAW
jgi:hypothetical protein